GTGGALRPPDVGNMTMAGTGLAATPRAATSTPGWQCHDGWAMEISSRPRTLLRQPGCLRETRGFASPPRDGFASLSGADDGSVPARGWHGRAEPVTGAWRSPGRVSVIYRAALQTFQGGEGASRRRRPPGDRGRGEARRHRSRGGAAADQ